MTSGALPRPRHRWYAAVYDSFIGRSSEKRLAPVRDGLVRQASGRVLELGCGTGINFGHYDWPKVESLVATEPDTFMLRRAEAHLSAFDADVRAKVTLQEVPAEALPFDDAMFDCVVATLVMCTVSDPVRALTEAYRVLRAGGRLLLLEHVASLGFEAGVQRAIQPVYGWMAAGCRLDRHTEDVVRGAGFDLEVTQRLRLGPLYPAFAGVATKPA